MPKKTTKEWVFAACVVAVAIGLASYGNYLRRSELRQIQEVNTEKLKNRKEWMEEMDAFRKEVESRFGKRWTSEDHDAWEKSLYSENPDLKHSKFPNKQF